MALHLRAISPTMKTLVQGKSILFLCDLQAKFRSAIYGFDHVVNTANKMLKIAKILGIQVLVTEQNPKGLGNMVPDIDVQSLGPLYLGTFTKTKFSMLTNQVDSILQSEKPDHIILFGIESHVCVLQTAIDLIHQGYVVHVLADGVSSCNQEEIPLALSRIRQEGGLVTTSESVVFQLTADASVPTFKAISNVIKEEKDRTKKTLQTLMSFEKSSL